MISNLLQEDLKEGVNVKYYCSNFSGITAMLLYFGEAVSFSDALHCLASG